MLLQCGSFRGTNSSVCVPEASHPEPPHRGTLRQMRCGTCCLADLSPTPVYCLSAAHRHHRHHQRYQHSLTVGVMAAQSAFRVDYHCHHIQRAAGVSDGDAEDSNKPSLMTGGTSGHRRPLDFIHHNIRRRHLTHHATDPTMAGREYRPGTRWRL